MVICFSDVAPDVEQSFTDNRSLLRQKLESHPADQPHQRSSRRPRAAADWRIRAVPVTQKSRDRCPSCRRAASHAVPVHRRWFYERAWDFSLGNLEPILFRSWVESPENVAIVAFPANVNWKSRTRLADFGPASRWKDSGTRGRDAFTCHCTWTVNWARKAAGCHDASAGGDRWRRFRPGSDIEQRPEAGTGSPGSN